MRDAPLSPPARRCTAPAVYTHLEIGFGAWRRQHTYAHLPDVKVLRVGLGALLKQLACGLDVPRLLLQDRQRLQWF